MVRKRLNVFRKINSNVLFTSGLLLNYKADAALKAFLSSSYLKFPSSRTNYMTSPVFRDTLTHWHVFVRFFRGNSKTHYDDSRNVGNVGRRPYLEWRRGVVVFDGELVLMPGVLGTSSLQNEQPENRTSRQFCRQSFTISLFPQWCAVSEENRIPWY